MGAVFLATGGGGDPYVPRLMAQRVIDEHGPVDLIAVEDLDDDAYVVGIGGVGAPTASLELLPSLDDAAQILEIFEEHVGRKVDAVVSFEIGGANSLIPIVAAAGRGIPVVDGDGMGRALPEAQMMTYPIAGVAPTPAVALDYEGNYATLTTGNTLTYERHIRSLAQAMGGMITTAEHPMSGAELKEAIVPDTISFSIEIGRVLREHRGNARDTFKPLQDAFDGSIYGDLFHLCSGKVTDYSSRIVGGYDVGEAVIEPFDGNLPPVRLSVKNEFLTAFAGDQLMASVPDLITILDFETSMPINAERLRYGQRVTVLGVGCPDFYRSETALRVVAPRCFGFDFEFDPIERLQAYHQPIPES